MNKYGLTFTEVAGAVQHSNLNMTGQVLIIKEVE